MEWTPDDLRKLADILYLYSFVIFKNPDKHLTVQHYVGFFVG